MTKFQVSLFINDGCLQLQFYYYYQYCCCVAQISDEEDNNVKERGIKAELIAKTQKLTKSSKALTMVHCVELLLHLFHEEALLLATKEDDDDNDVNKFFVDIVTP